ncbi:ATP-binding protein [Streptomyces yaizuensis]|uniref:AAA family ATPase n=1 Tax=Streptomyces yaizuensis TaxID=2989713 RepID=A0ABQ5NSB2_9ACTN|nr:ATP-binding protein [Streptomyces sp. YSPA8]GLF93142.1 AAA family ATPase [Streptomyces sp. YSPA8]
MSTTPSDAASDPPHPAPGAPPGTPPTTPADVVRIFTARLREELRSGEGPGGPAPARRAYREAACLLSHFDPTLLRLPGEEQPTGGAVLELVDDCTTTGTKEGTVWSLRREVRDETLRSLSGPGAARRALEHNLGAVQDERCGGPERVALACLAGTPPRIDGLGPQGLADLLRAVLWLSRVPGTGGLPDPSSVHHALARARLLQPLERLVSHPFQGRARELAALRAYVRGALDLPAAPPAAPGGAGTGAAPAPPVPPLVIHGPGGMGKSTLLARFLLDSIHGHASGFPFAYIDFERPTLSVHEPVTLIAETARQLAIQYPGRRAGFEALVDECHRTARSQREGQERVTQLHGLATTRSVLGRSSSQEFQTLATARESDLIRRTAAELVAAVAEAGQDGAPLVMVVDSFEAAQYRGSPVLGRMWAMCVSLQSVYPRLRIVISGRASVEHPADFPRSPDIELSELDPDAAVALLTSSGVSDPEVARALAERVGGHPLSLRLAARAATLAAPADGTADATAEDRADAGYAGAGPPGTDADELIRSLPERRDTVFRRVDQMLVQGILYDRILHHIPDPEVRRLAHPGLVLRVITPGIIQEVLAGPCGLGVDTPEDALRLYGELARLDLVEPAGPGAVRHRGDVRAIMLRLPGGDRTGVMRAVEQNAVAYYAARDGLEARAEEIYHRLRLDEDPRTVEERWLPGVERLLAGAVDDMPHRAAALLTARLGGEAPRPVLAGAEQEDWERIAAREVEDLLAQGFAEAALERLSERRPWTPCAPLHPLLGETLHRIGRADEARTAVADATAAAEAAGCSGTLLELLLLAARLSEEAGDTGAADRALRRAEDLAVDLGQDLEAMGALLARARLGGTEGTGSAAGSRLAQRLRHTPDAVLADQPALVRAVASQVYGRDPGALDHALEVVGLPTDDEAVETLGAAIRTAASRRPELLGTLMGLLRDAAGPTGPSASTGPTSTSDILRLARDRGTLDTLARRLLDVPDPSGEIAAAVAAAMGAGTGAAPPTAPPAAPPAAPPTAPPAAPLPGAPGPRGAPPGEGNGLVRPGRP